jgi:hypothetical protein
LDILIFLEMSENIEAEWKFQQAFGDAKVTTETLEG